MEKVSNLGYEDYDEEFAGEAFCIEPWRQIHFDSQGRPGPCCNYRHRSLSNRTSVEEYLKSKELDQIKKKLLEGKPIKGCSSCYRHENENKTSMRQRRNERYGTDFANTRESHLMVTLGNLCNIACRMCNPSRSSQISKNYQKIIDKDIDGDKSYIREQLKTVQKVDPWKDGEKLDGLLYLAERISRLEVSGGEPFIYPQFTKFLEKISETPFQKSIDLSITTNGSLKSRQLELLEGFRSCHLSISLDSIGSYYDLTRWPANWETTSVNLKNIFEKCKKVEWTFVSVPMNFHLEGIYESIEWFIRHGNKRYKRFMFSHLNSKFFYHPAIAPKSVKEKALNDIEKLLRFDLRKEEVESLKDLSNEIQVIFEPEVFDLYKKQFVNYTQLLDKARNQNTWEAIGWCPKDIVQ